jgi:glycosyltransferase involved in cell wall biosynthesis
MRTAFPLGRRTDVPDLLVALDLLASPSVTEAFPWVLGDAMLCEVRCAVTDCGDSRDIVGEGGPVLNPRDPSALAGAIQELLAMPIAARATRRGGTRDRAGAVRHPCRGSALRGTVRRGDRGDASTVTIQDLEPHAMRPSLFRVAAWRPLYS